MPDADSKIDADFFQLVFSLQIAAMQQLGKIMSPITGKVERNLEQAKASIGMLEMLAAKTRGNLSAEEDDFLGRILFELRMNYLDEVKKPAEAAAERPSEGKKESDKDSGPTVN